MKPDAAQFGELAQDLRQLLPTIFKHIPANLEFNWMSDDVHTVERGFLITGSPLNGQPSIEEMAVSLKSAGWIWSLCC
jgi:hypothetical protein